MARAEQVVSIIGDRELATRIMALPDDVLKKVMKPAIAAGLKPVEAQAKANAAPGAVLSAEASGLMQQAIQSSTSASKTKDRITGKVYVNRKTEGVVNGKRHVPGNVAHLVEFGHAGKAPAPAHPFLRPALDSAKARAYGKVEEVARRNFNKIGKP